MFYVNAGSIIAIGLLFPILTAVAVAARFAVRRVLRQPYGADDWTCIPAWLLTTACGVLLVVGAKLQVLGYSGIPQSPQDVPIVKSRVRIDLQLVFLFNILQIMAVGVIKLSLSFFYRRIFRGNRFNIVSWATISVLVAWMVAFFIAALSECDDNLAAVYNSGDPAFLLSHCNNDTEVIVVTMAITDLILDLVVLITPLPWIWTLQMPTSQKIAVTSVFAIGLFSFATACVRTAAVIESSLVWPHLGVTSNILGFTDTADPIGVQALYMFWCYISIGTGMTVCCLLTLKPVLKLSAVQRIFDSIRRASAYSIAGLTRRRSSGERENSGAGDRTRSVVDLNEKKRRSITTTSEIHRGAGMV